MPKRNLIVFDDNAWNTLLPLTWLKPVGELRIGLLTIAERWEKLLTGRASFLSQSHLSDEYPMTLAKSNYLVNASYIPTPELAERILELSEGEALLKDDELIAAKLDDKAILNMENESEENPNIAGYPYDEDLIRIQRPYDIFTYNAQVIEQDLSVILKTRRSQQLSKTNTVIGNHPVFIEPGASCECTVLNTTDGPIYIGKNANVMEGSLLRGPIAICESGTIKMGAKIYKGTTIGPHCKVGGEVSNVVFQGYSNKGHDGYLGNAVIGEWCNLGADTNSSNLKNNYAEVKVWSYQKEGFEKSGLTFCGLIMGDHSKCGINTMFNTATVVGVCSNIYGSGFPRTFIPDFSWGGASGFTTHRLNKVFETASKMMARRNKTLSENQKNIIEAVFNSSTKLRPWEQQ